MLVDERSLDKFKRIKITPRMFSDNKRSNVETNTRMKFGKT
jgi:hypothetical protein